MLSAGFESSVQAAKDRAAILIFIITCRKRNQKLYNV
jgi:hypothetical protein